MDKFVVMISGANRGIGLEIAKKLFQDTKYYLSLGVRNIEDIDLSRDFPDSDRVLVNHYDALESETGRLWINHTREKFSQIDGLVNNAGILRSCSMDDYDERVLDEMWQVNTKAPVTLTHDLWNDLKQSGKGRIVNLVSVAGKSTRGDQFGYNLTKHAMMAFTHSLRQAGWGDGIRVTAICPGWVNTDMATRAEICQLSPEEMTQPGDVAKLVKMVMELPNTAAVADITVNSICGPFF